MYVSQNKSWMIGTWFCYVFMDHPSYVMWIILTLSIRCSLTFPEYKCGFQICKKMFAMYGARAPGAQTRW